MRHLLGSSKVFGYLGLRTNTRCAIEIDRLASYGKLACTIFYLHIEFSTGRRSPLSKSIFFFNMADHSNIRSLNAHWGLCGLAALSWKVTNLRWTQQMIFDGGISWVRLDLSTFQNERNWDEMLLPGGHELGYVFTVFLGLPAVLFTYIYLYFSP